MSCIKPSIRDIERAVCEHFGLTAGELRGESRVRDISRPRQIAFYLAREMGGHSYPKIGYYFGGRDHTTALHGYRAVSKRIEERPKFHLRVATIRASVVVKPLYPTPAQTASIREAHEEEARLGMMGLA